MKAVTLRDFGDPEMMELSNYKRMQSGQQIATGLYKASVVGRKSPLADRI
jgi:hypothetical protein